MSGEIFLATDETRIGKAGQKLESKIKSQARNEMDASGTSYFLRSIGPDGIPFTADDILPSISEEERKNTGLKLER
jgi:hypothetical protein